MFCSKCGRKLTDQDRFCPGCGAAQVPAVPQRAPAAASQVLQKKKRKFSLGWILSITAAVLVIAVALSLLLPTFGSDKVTLYVLTAKTEYINGIPYKRTEYTYDNAAQLLMIKEDLGKIIRVWSTELGIYQNEYQPYDGEVDDISEFGYDEAGNLTFRKDDEFYRHGFEYTYVYDADGRIESCTTRNLHYQRDMCVHSFDYDFDGNILSISEQSRVAGALSLPADQFQYDSDGRLIQETIHEARSSRSIKYFYQDDLLIRAECYHIDREADNALTLLEYMDFAYDNSGRLLKITRYNWDDSIEDRIHYAYDAEGHLISRSGGEYPEVYECDKHGNIVRVDFVEGSWFEYEYKAIHVTAQQAEAYRNRQRILNYIYLEDYIDYSHILGYSLIPNPLWELPFRHLPFKLLS